MTKSGQFGGILPGKGGYYQFVAILMAGKLGIHAVHRHASGKLAY
jgi:hypothetical protein